MDRSLRFTHDDYTVACICPMGVELAPVEAMLDEVHQGLSGRSGNTYTLGRMGVHNVVIAVMPEIGNSNAATVATQLLNDFRSIKFGLLVGIGGGVPGDEEDDIRLGDVVVSKPTAAFGGVVQFDRGKVHSNGQFERTGTLQKPPKVLLANVQKLEAQQKREGNKTSKYLSEMLERFPNLEDEQYNYPGMEYDQLFEPSYIHGGGKTCRRCDQSKVVERAPRKYSTPRIHYGTIGSANEVVKDSKTRDKLREDLGIICVEMEAAGLMDEFPCLVIRGICDYADSHKNKRWQPYAAATAAAYAKELLSIIPAQEMAPATRGTAADFQDGVSMVFGNRLFLNY
jgi:nucleoside phosphorylase